METRPLNDFATTTIVETRCRNSSVGHGAVVNINADRSGGLNATITTYLERQSDGTQTLTLVTWPTSSTIKTLCTSTRLSSDYVRLRLIIDTQHNVVNLHINDEDQGAFAYSTYAPSTNDRFLSAFEFTSGADFDYIEVRVAN